MPDQQDIREKLSRSTRYGISIGVFLSALALRIALAPAQSGLAFVTFYPAFIITFYVLGNGPGWLVVTLSAISAYYFSLPPFWDFAPTRASVAATAGFLGSAWITARVFKRLEQTRERLRKTYSALAVNEQRYLSILENQTELICRFKADGTVLYVNDAFCKFLERSRDNIVGSCWRPVAIPEDVARLQEELTKLTPLNPVVPIENRVVTPTKATRWCQFINRGIFDSDGRLLEIQSVGRDITARKDAEIALRASENELKVAQHLAGIGNWDWDLRTDVHTWSDEIFAIYGHDRSLPPARYPEVRQYFTAESWAVLGATVERCLVDGNPYRCDAEVVRPNGSHRWVAILAEPIRDASGNMVRVHGTVQDITERKLLEEELATSETQLKDLLDNAPCGYHSLGLDGTYLRINETELAWLGRRREEVLGKLTPADHFTPEGKEYFRREFARFKVEGSMRGAEFDLVSTTGEIRHVSVSATAVRDRAGNLVSSRSVMYDITELARIRAEFRDLTLEQHAMLDTELIGILKLRDSRAIWLNKAMHRIFGYEEDELIGKSPRILYPDDVSFNAQVEAAYPALQSGTPYRTHVELVRKGGQRIWVDMSGVQLKAGTGESLWMIADITAMKEHEARLDRLASFDALTGLLNRRLLDDYLGQSIARARRHSGLMAVLYLDLDEFKALNDELGHAAGDHVLRVVAQRLVDGTRKSDRAARVGGDEFVIVLDEVEDDRAAGRVAQKILRSLQEPICVQNGVNRTIRASIGISVFPNDASDIDELLAHADHAMYQSKKTRNSYTFFSDCRMTSGVPT